MTRLTGTLGFLGIASTILTLALPLPSEAQDGVRNVRCRVESEGSLAYSGLCRFVPDGGNGSFALASVNGDAPLFGTIQIVSVTIVQRGVAEVRGLTKDGINSRWGEARRSTQDRACWVGSDFKICAW